MTKNLELDPVLIPGLASVTFRRLSPDEIAMLARACGLEAIEWGGDIHVPSGDIVNATKVRQMTRDLGLQVAAYGSYFKIINPDGTTPDFGPTLETALALEAPRIRVWAGAKSSLEATANDFHRVANRLQEIAKEAAACGVKISLEAHSGTLTDSSSATLRLLALCNHSNVDLVWQPDPALSGEACAEGLATCLPHVSNLHVFHWHSHGDRRPLAEGRDRWLRYLEIAARQPKPRFVLLEFVREDDPTHLGPDAAELRRLLADIHPSPIHV